MRQTEPTIIRKGESVEWERSFSAYPPDEWTLQYRFRGSGPGFDVTATTGPSTGFTAAITPTHSALPDIGKYEWQAWATNIADTSITRMIGAGYVEIRRGFAAGDTGNIDLRSTAKQIVDALEAALLGNASSSQMEYEISTPAGSRRVKYMSRKEQTDLLAYYKKVVRRENAADAMRNGEKWGTKVKVRMP